MGTSEVLNRTQTGFGGISGLEHTQIATGQDAEKPDAASQLVLL